MAPSPWPSFSTLHAAGFPCVPIVPAGATFKAWDEKNGVWRQRPGGKVPGRLAGGEWRAMYGWQRFGDGHAGGGGGVTLGVWDSWRGLGAGAGILCGGAGGLIGIDIDITEARVAAVVRGEVERVLGPTPFRRIGRAPKELLLYRAADAATGAGGRLRTRGWSGTDGMQCVEILRTGQQFVAFGVHPATGAPYRWVEAAPGVAGATAADVPEVEDWELRALVESIEALVGPDGLGFDLKGYGGGGAGRGGGASGDGDRVPGDLSDRFGLLLDALAALPNDDDHYEDWIRVGLAIKGAVGAALEEGEALEAWHDWSAKSAKYDAAETERAWASFKPRGIGAGTIYRLALDAGWSGRPGPDVLDDFGGAGSGDGSGGDGSGGGGDGGGTVAALPWPRALNYAPIKKHAAQCAKLFLDEREKSGRPLLYGRGEFFEWSGARWQTLSTDHLLAEIRTTDRTAMRLDVWQVEAMARAIKHASRQVPAPPCWLERAGSGGFGGFGDAAMRERPAVENLIVFRNGVFDAGSEAWLGVRRDLFTLGATDFDYDADARCPAWEAFLAENLDPDDVLTLQEYAGYCMVYDTSYHKILALIGARRGGKSTIARILSALVGRGSTASPQISDVAGDFGLQSLLDARLIVLNESQAVDFSRRSAGLERLKAISGADMLDVNRKFLGALSGVQLPGRIVMVGNGLPQFMDDSGAFAQRLMVLHFAKSHLGEEDAGLPKRLLGELSGIANWAIAGLVRLRAADGAFTRSAGSLARGAAAENDQSNIRQFLEDCAKEETDAVTTFRDAYEAYRAWARFEGLEVRGVSQNRLAKAIETIWPGVDATRTRPGGRKAVGNRTVRALNGVKLLNSGFSDFD